MTTRFNCKIQATMLVGSVLMISACGFTKSGTFAKIDDSIKDR